MPIYSDLRKWKDEAARSHVADRLLAIRNKLKNEVFPAKSDRSLLLATWNIRDFDSNKFGHGRRLPESFYYIAEIISAFDIVAVQEVNRDLSALWKVKGLLGPSWDFIATDTTEGSGGNTERLAFLYDRRKVRFRKIAGEVVLPKGQKIVSRKKLRTDRDSGAEVVQEDELQFARTPFVVAFQSNWFKFNLCTVHIYFGSSSGKKLEQRIAEIERIAKFFAKRQEKEEGDYILLGDFNIVSPEHRTMEALEAQDFQIPENLKKEKTNLKGDKHYDQIALKVEDKRLEIGASGVFDFRRLVFRSQDFDSYFDKMHASKRDFHQKGAKKGQPRTDEEKLDYYLEEWRTWQMSDHMPMWVELKTDFSDDYLEALKS